MLLKIMRDALVLLDASGIIRKYYFDQLELSLQPKRSIFKLFDERFSKWLQHSLKTTNTSQIQFKSDDYHALLSQQSSYALLYVSDTEIIHAERMEPLMKSMLEELGNQIAKPTETRTYLEDVQRLNNEVINKTRLIEKMNHQLQKANRILNDRLIKDPLTSLISRYQYRDEIALIMNKAPRDPGFFCFIDLDDFKAINDTYGHQTGDEVLVEFAKRLKALPFERCLKMRIAGDEFGLYVHGKALKDECDFMPFWQHIKNDVLQQVNVNGHTIQLTSSVGVARYPCDADDINELIDFADYAMYIAKKKGKNDYSLFDRAHYNKHKSHA